MDVIEVDANIASSQNYLLGNVFIAENEPSMEWFKQNQWSRGSGKDGKYVKGKYSLPVAAWDCLKERKSAGRKILKNFKRDRCRTGNCRRRA